MIQIKNYFKEFTAYRPITAKRREEIDITLIIQIWNEVVVEEVWQSRHELQLYASATIVSKISQAPDTRLA